MGMQKKRKQNDDNGDCVSVLEIFYGFLKWVTCTDYGNFYIKSDVSLNNKFE